MTGLERVAHMLAGFYAAKYDLSKEMPSAGEIKEAVRCSSLMIYSDLNDKAKAELNQYLKD